MNNDLLHVPSGRTFNLYAADAGGEGRDIVDRVYGHCMRGGPLLCGEHGSPVYLQKRRGHFWAIHFDGRYADHGPGMTDEHKRQTEYEVDPDDIKHAVTTAMGAVGVRPENTFRYFCGIVWRIIRDLQETAGHLVVAEVNDEIFGEG